ncbi:uncharacterized protein BKCO1_3000058 [Diplodia corticola]|uniref:Uncharacterized protein n=1 Tax=Diplodia corticola TaxID=236234 RepID=A0A1J9QYH0_9PEZI|nr:uncharacterized protein BKCO1_3000058 [Diplodia corticola]OJD33425.1 hypothetical protein BKCO1_3000058 [Diplodia corticola]
MATAHPTAYGEGEPPSYAIIFPERDPARTDVIKAACRALDHRDHSPFGSADARSIHRLRNWLCYMLMVDYEVATASTTITLSATDAAHFDNLFAILEAYSAITSTTQPHPNKNASSTSTTTAAKNNNADNDRSAAALEALYWQHIHLPSQALNLPTAAVALCLRRFAVAKTAPLNTYAGCGDGHAAVRAHGARAWAAKLLTDRAVLVPRVAPNRAVEQGLLQAIARLGEKWFVGLRGFDCVVAERLESRPSGWARWGDDYDGGWRHEVVGAFELTEMGKRWEARCAAAAEVAEQQQLRQHSGGGASLWERVRRNVGMLGWTGASSSGQQRRQRQRQQPRPSRSMGLADDDTDSFSITKSPEDWSGESKRLD